MASPLDYSRLLCLSDDFAISCGTVPIDVTKSKVLLLHYRVTGEIFLPKGRKNIDESLEQAAVRETHEETGYHCELLPLDMPTHATGEPGSTGITEPIAVTTRQARVLKIMFWYVARVDSCITPDEGTQESGEEFDALWVTADEAIKKLSFDDDKAIVLKALECVQRTYWSKQL